MIEYLFQLTAIFPAWTESVFKVGIEYAGIRLIGSIEKRKKFSYRCT